MLVELSVMEQRYQAVLEVLVHGATVTEVARRYGVSRASVHAWIRRYQTGSIAALADRSHRPDHHPRQLAADIEAVLCEMRRAHPRWGPRRLVYELGRRKGKEVSRSSVYRILVRNHLVDGKARKRRREDYVRWQREAPMQLWQLDVMEPVRLEGGRQAKLVSGVDDHSRFCVIATVVPRATGRAVCAAFGQAMRTYGVPEEVLTDNGKVFTGRFGPPPHAEVLFERILRENGIKQRLTGVRSPTTTGKVERWHQTIQDELLDDAAPFADLAAAQAAVDRWREEYNNERPHQALDMATPASRFRAVPTADRATLPLVLPPQLDAVRTPATVDGAADSGYSRPASPSPRGSPSIVGSGFGPSQPTKAVCAPTTSSEALRSAASDEPARPVSPAVARRTGAFDAVEIERMVPPSGNLAVCGQQFWLGEKRVGKIVTLWIDTKKVYLSIDGRRIKELGSRLSAADLARLRAGGARPAGPPPPRPAERGIGRDVAVEVDRTVNKGGSVGIAKAFVVVGMAYAGQRVTLRLEGDLVHVVAGGVLVKTVPSPLTPEQRARLTTARLAGAPPVVYTGPTRVFRTVSE
ncbi:MAG: IS481 family transposase, partial [Acidimicrobiia bacterium]